MLKIRRALISVSDKMGIVDLAKELNNFKVEILSTAGTANLLRENNIPVIEVSQYTGFPEMLNGRIRTLHPKIHAGILALRDNPQHLKALENQDIGLIDMVVVNLYPFEKTINKPGVSLEEAIENIDIGGPAMLRSAAKNHKDVAVICNPRRYPQVIEELKKYNGSLSESLLSDLAVEVFKTTHLYDRAIYDYLRKCYKEVSGYQGIRVSGFPEELKLEFIKLKDLRYGENPHQKASLYKELDQSLGVAAFRQFGGKELSFNNILDLNAAVNIVREFDQPAVVFIKHNNPCGVAENKDIFKAYKDAWNCDRLSAFGGIVAINRKIDLALAKLITQSGFLECIITLEFTPDALALLKEKKNLRLIEFPDLLKKNFDLDFRRVEGGLLLQEADSLTLDEQNLRIVTKKKPTASQMQSLIFGWKVAKHVKSNAIVLTRGTKTVGIGAGQMSRVDAVFMAIKKAGKLSRGACLASDAFFPKEDAIQLAGRYKVKAIIQPGGSLADEAIIKMADKYKIAMVTTGIRHFRH
ncbi:MAG: bifunctional phosphoribosylaminoimidazolecarboxamide formyltransferase/IMP cyclohydrolase [Candidatus Omnitrophica bacterium]|nr:bifunctional phosphoribosylaminoimidazolecarboxamide formyltransferase/IMP cyclohydrolase [Candidatus Omnitrophota bacterium]